MNDSVDPPDVTTIDGTSRIGGSAKSDQKSRRTSLKVLLAQNSTVSGAAPSFMVTQRPRGHRGRVRDWARPFRAEAANHRSSASSERFFLELVEVTSSSATPVAPDRYGVHHVHRSMAGYYERQHVTQHTASKARRKPLAEALGTN